MKNKKRRNVWIMTAIYWVVGFLTLINGQLDHLFAYHLKNIASIYTIGLFIILLLPLFLSLSLFIIKPPRLICNPLVAFTYLLIVISAGLAYDLQNIIGYIFLVIIFIVIAGGTMFYAIFKTFKHKKDDSYYFINGKDEKKCSSFWDAFKIYYCYGLTNGFFEILLAIIFN